MAESSDELRERLGCYLLIAVWFLIVLPCIVAPWLILSHFGPTYSILCVFAVHGLWYLVAGPPMAMSGSKPSTFGWMLIIASTWPAVIVNVVLLLMRLL